MANHPGARIRTWIDRNCSSQVELARSLRISPSHLNQIINGGKVPSLELALELEAKRIVPAKAWRGVEAVREEAAS